MFCLHTASAWLIAAVHAAMAAVVAVASGSGDAYHVPPAPRLLHGSSNFVVTLGATRHPPKQPAGSGPVAFADTLDDLGAMTNFTNFGLGTVFDGFDPSPHLGHNGNSAVLSLLAKKRLPEFWYIGGPQQATELAEQPPTRDHNETFRIRMFDQVDVFNSYRVSEWGWGFFVNSEGATPTLPDGQWGWCKSSLYNDSSPAGAPQSKTDAEKSVQARYLRWASAVGGRLNSRPSWSFYLHEPMRWSIAAGHDRKHLGTGFELNGGPDAQAHTAFARGAARQWKVPWLFDLSPWHSGSVATTGPVRLGKSNTTWIGASSGKSDSFMFRAMVYGWFAGAASLNAQGAAMYAFTFEGEPDAPWPCPPTRSDVDQRATIGVDLGDDCKVPLTRPPFAALQLTQPRGQTLAKAKALFDSRDRGVSFTPVAIVIDKLAGYNGSPCGGPNRSVWGALQPTQVDQEIGLLLEKQLVPGGFAYPDRIDQHGEIPLSEYEAVQLRPTPHGEMADVLQSDASADLLGSYAAVILAGEITMDKVFVDKLQQAAQLVATRYAGSQLRLFMRAHHSKQLTKTQLQQLKMSTMLSITTRGPRAVSTPELDALSQILMPVSVRADPERRAMRSRTVTTKPTMTQRLPGVQWSVNRQTTSNGTAGNWLVHLANNQGVLKPGNASETLDPDAAVIVTVTPKNFAFTEVIEWISNTSLEVGGSACVNFTLGPGAVAILEFVGSNSK